LLPRVRLNPGENSRLRVVTRQEEDAYLKAATELGRTQESDYAQALKGIRATVRGERPIKPDAYLLLHIATVLLECALRPDECYRLKWNQIQDEAIIIHEGKGKGSRRPVPCTKRVMGILEMRRAESEWVFPRETASGHVEASTLKKQHEAAIKAAEVSPFVIYDFRHSRITRWAKVLPLPVVQRLAGHTEISTTMGTSI